MQDRPVAGEERSLPAPRGWRRPLVVLTVVVGGLLSAALYVLGRDLAEEQLDRAVERAGRTHASALRIALEEDLEALVALRSLWSASQEVTRDEFRAFTLPLLQRHPALRALEWAPAVAPQDVGALEQRVRASGHQEFAVRALPEETGAPAVPGGRLLFPLEYLEPLAGNAAALGLDLSSEGRRQQALRDAEAAGDVRASEPVRLLQQPDELALLLCLPVWGVAPGSRAGAYAGRPRGFVVAVCGIEQAIRGALEAWRPEELGLCVVIRSQGRCVMTFDLEQPHPQGGAVALGDGLRLVEAFDLAGLRWLVHARPGPELQAGVSGGIALLGLLGLGLTLLLAWRLSLREQRSRDLELANLELSRSSRERAQALDALRVSEQRFRSLFEHHGSMMIVVDHETGDIVDANAAAEAFYGYPEAQLRRLRLQDLDLMPAEQVRELLDRAASAPRGHVVLPHRLASGETRTVEIHSTPIEYQGRRLVFAIVHDVSEREAIQRRLAESQKLESLGVLAGGIAHDFNNLLSSVIGNAELAERQLPAGSPARRHLGLTLLASQQAAELVRRLLSYAGQGSQERVALDLREPLREALELVRPNVPATVRVELEQAERLPLVRGDRLQLQQVIVNLVLNAIESFEGRAGTVRVRTSASGRPDEGVLPLGPCAAAHPETHVLLEVADDGPGMDERTQARIFEPFFSTKFAGRGLGLASVLGILRAHEGQVDVDSAPGRGTTFRVWLPATQVEPPGVRPRGARALVVDDEPAVREVAAGMLVAQGFEVTQDQDLGAALGRLQEHDPPCALVVLDLGVLGAGGAEGLRRLRERAPRAALLVMSGYDEQEALQRCGDEAPDGFLQKPFGAAALGDAVRAALKRRVPLPPQEPAAAGRRPGQDAPGAPTDAL